MDTPTVVYGNTHDAIKNKTLVTLASLKAAFRTGKGVDEAGTGHTAVVSTQFIVTVGRAGGSCWEEFTPTLDNYSIRY